MFCSNCGGKAPKESKFCSSCGAMLEKDPKSVDSPSEDNGKNIKGKVPVIVMAVALVLVAIVSLASSKQLSAKEDPLEFRNLQGTFVLVDELVTQEDMDECLVSLKYKQEICGNLRFNFDTYLCQGGGPFGDVSQGAVVEVSDSKGETLAIGSLKPGTFSMDNFVKSSGGITTSCPMTFSVSKVPVVEGPYVVTVGTRGSRSYSLQELEQSNWILEYTLGQ